MSSINLSALKKSASKDLLNKLQKGLEDSASKGRQTDERFWNPTIDSAGNGSAIIRFLPAKTEDSFPFVKEYKHAFQENGMWFIMECPTTIGKQCPACSENSKLWATGLDSDKEVARKRKRKLKYIANVLIVKDPANPENDGQVKLWKFGSKIFDKIEECFKVDPDLGEEPMNPFSFFDGANFAIKTQMLGGFINYDKCKFVKANDLYDGDEEKLVELMEKMYDLSEFHKEDRFKPEADILARYNKVTGVEAAQSRPSVKDQLAEDVPSGASEKYVGSQESASTTDASDETDEDFFRKLLNG